MMLSISYAHYNFIIDINDNNQRPNTKGSTYSPFGIDVNNNFHLYIHVYLYILYLYMYTCISMCNYNCISIMKTSSSFFSPFDINDKGDIPRFQCNKMISKICSPWNLSLIYELMQEKRGIKPPILFLTLQMWLLREVL